MAHMIEKHDKQQGRKRAWHGLTEIKADLTLDDCYLSQWDVEPVELVTMDGGQSGFKMLQCSDNGLLVGKPYADSYFPITNKMLIDIVSQTLAGTKHVVESLGSVCNRNRTFISVELHGLEAFKVGKREFETFLNFGNSFDGSTVFYVNTSNICTVCNNTFTANLHHKGTLVNVRLKHTKSAEHKIENLPEILDAAIGVQAEFRAAMEQFANVSCNETKAERLFAGFVGEGKEKLSTRSRNQVEKLVSLFRNGRGNSGENMLDAFSAITDYYTHESSGGEDRQKQFESSEFGNGAKRKQEFFGILSDRNRTAETIKLGDSLLIAN